MDRVTSWLASVLVGTAVLFSALLLYLPRESAVPARTSQTVLPPRAASAAQTLVVQTAEIAQQEMVAIQPQVEQGAEPADPPRQTRNPQVAGGQQQVGIARQVAGGQPPDGIAQQAGPGQQPAPGQAAANPQVDVTQANPTEGVRNQLRRDRPDLVAFGEGFQRMLEGKYAEAARSFQRLVTGHPDSEYHDDGLYWLGFSLAESGRDEEALAALNDVLTRYPASAYADDALLKIGLIHQRREDMAGAEKAFQRAVEQYPNGEATLSCAQNLATIQESNGCWDKAQKSWTFSDEQARNQLGETDNYYGNRARNRVQWIQENCDNGGEPLRFFTQGEILLAERRPDAAVAQFLTVLREFPRSNLVPAARYKLGLCYRAQGNLGKAADAFAEANQAATDAAIRDASAAALLDLRVESERIAKEKRTQAERQEPAHPAK